MEFPNLGSFDPRSIQVLDYFRNITLDDVKDFIKQKKLELAAAGILLSSFLGVAVMSTLHMSAMKALEAQQVALHEKTEPVRKYKEVMKKQAEFMEGLPPALEENNFITVLTDIATTRAVRITDFTPPVLQEDRYYKKLTSKLVFTAPEFRNVILFINDLERSDYAIKVDSWALHVQQGKTASGVMGKASHSDTRMFIMDLVISSVKIVDSSKADTPKADNSKSGVKVKPKPTKNEQ